MGAGMDEGVFTRYVYEYLISQGINLHLANACNIHTVNLIRPFMRSFRYGLYR